MFTSTALITKINTHSGTLYYYKSSGIKNTKYNKIQTESTIYESQFV